jgi:hypothetical protein
MAAATDVTPFTTAAEFWGDLPTWVDSIDGQRLASYVTYQNMYFNETTAFRLIMRNDDGSPLYLPKPRVVVDTTAHYLLKGLRIHLADPEKNAEMDLFMTDFFNRERFYSRFHIAKHAGVIRGDWVMHLTADPLKPEGSRISLTSVDPAWYFPELDPDDVERRTGAKLVQPTVHPDDPTKTVLKVLRYWYNLDPATGARLDQLVWRQEDVWEVDNWMDPKKAKKVNVLLPPEPLPTDITQIPLYHFKNAEFDGFEFGNSELKGFERIFQGMNQAITDEELSLALAGLGVYATDAGRPRDENGNETDWVVVPGTVWEMPGATMVKRLEGITSVKPVLDHIEFIDGATNQATGTSDVALGNIDVNTAESGIALAIKFIPTLAKIEHRDTSGIEVLTQLWYDWKFWVKAYEAKDFTATEIIVSIGEKLPINRPKVFEELNALYDRKIISAEYYRERLHAILDYDFPDNIAQQIIDEQTAVAKAMLEVQVDQFGNPPTPNNSGPGGRKVGAGDTLPPSQTTTSNNKNGASQAPGKPGP